MELRALAFVAVSGHLNKQSESTCEFS
jgi:hypothetical protein